MDQKSTLMEQVKFWGPLIYAVVISLIFGFMHRPAEMGLATATGLLIFAVLHLEKFESFKGAGFEAKMRDAVNEAYATIDKLQDVAAALAEPSVVSIAMHKRLFQYIPLTERFKQIDEIKKSLRDVGLPEERVSKVTEFFYEVVGYDHHNKILWSMVKEEEMPEELRVQARKHADARSNEFDAVEFVSESGWPPGPLTAQALEDLRFFNETKTLRRPEEWQ